MTPVVGSIVIPEGKLAAAYTSAWLAESVAVTSIVAVAPSVLVWVPGFVKLTVTVPLDATVHEKVALALAPLSTESVAVTVAL